MIVLSQCTSFEDVQDAWRSLLKGKDTKSPSLMSAWQQAWSQTIGRDKEFSFFILSDDGQVKGIAPLSIEQSSITFIGDPNLYDYCDFLVESGYEQIFFDELLRKLRSMTWDELYFFAIPQDSPTLEYLPISCNRAGLALEKKVEDVVPGVQLPNTWEEYLANLSKKNRHELKRKFTRLENKGNFSWCAKSTVADISADLDEFFRLLRSSGTHKSEFLTDQRAEFFRELSNRMAEQDIIRLFFLEVDGEKVASTLCFDWEGSRLLYNSGFNRDFSEYSVGLLLKVICLRDAIDQGKEYFDFLRGPERYKYQLGCNDREIYEIKITRQ